jgi:peptide/nickel transport system substrate-binding protein
VTKKLWSTFALLAVVGLVAGCGKPAPAATEQTADTPTSAAAEAKTLTLPGEDWGYPSPFAFYSRGPGYIRMSLLFDTLTWKDENGVIPWLADSWDTFEDGTAWTFTLHPGVTWHDGTPLTAEDVAFTFGYFKAHQASFKWSWPVDKVAGTEVVDERTVTLHLEEPIAGCHESLVGSLPIIPRHIWEGVEDPAKFMAEEAVVGSGPFELVEYNKEEARYIYEANSDYFKDAPAVDTLIFIKVENQALALETGTTDYASFWGKEIEAVQAFEDDETFGVISGPSFWVLQMIFNTQKAPFDNVDLRQAVAHAIDRQQIVEQVTHGGAIVANLGIVSPFTDWHNPELPTYEHDPSRAQRLLEEAGATNLSLTLITTGGFAREAELVQTDLEAIGFEVEVQTGDYSTIDGLLREGNFDLAINGHGGIANPAILRTPTWPAESYRNDAYDDLYRQQASTVNEEARRKLVWQLQETIVEDVPVLTLYHPKMWTVYDASALDTWFYTQGGVGFGIPISMNKLIFLP